jgi:hypothetical protein
LATVLLSTNALVEFRFIFLLAIGGCFWLQFQSIDATQCARADADDGKERHAIIPFHFGSRSVARGRQYPARFGDLMK